MHFVLENRHRPRATLAVLVGLACMLAVGLFLVTDAVRGRSTSAAVAEAFTSSLGTETVHASAEPVLIASSPHEPRELVRSGRPEVEPRATGGGEAIGSPDAIPESRLSGRVTEIGLPLAGAMLRFHATEAGELVRGEAVEARTDGDGRYRLERIPPGPYRLQVLHHSRSMVFESSFEVRAGEDELDLDLPLAVIEGRILDPHGAPLAGIRVHARDARVSAERARITSPSSGVLTQAAGRYALRGVPTDVELVVDAGGRGYQPGTSEVVRVAADGIRSGVDLTLARGADLDVLVRGPEGARANWRVEASPATELDDPTWTQETNSLGRASFAALAPGRWHVRVAAAGDDPGEVFAQEQIVDVALDQPNDVVFRVD